MEIEIQFPQLASEISDKGGFRYRLLPGKAIAEIPEISGDDAPVAVEFSAADALEVNELRYVDGKFYYRCADDPKTTVRDRITELMVEHFGDHLISNRHISQRVLANKVAINNDLWVIWKSAKRSSLRPNPSEVSGRSRTLARIQQAVFKDDTVANNAIVLKDWSEDAMEIAQSMLIIDGALWLPTTEPVFWMSIDPESNWTNVGNLDPFKLYRGPSTWLPKPYGFGKPRGFISRTWFQFWDPEWLCIPLVESTKYAFNQDGSKVTICMPEAFNSDLAPLILDRMARIVVVCVHSLASKFDKDVKEDAALLTSAKHLLQLTKSNQSPDLELVARLLDQMLQNLEDNFINKQRDINPLLNELSIGIQHALRKWEDREIAIDPPTNQQSTTLRFG